MTNIALAKKEQTLLSFDYQSEVEYIEGSIENIREMLPTLYAEQQEDVLRIEQRFQKGKGYLITNGTGTGKTYIGLGTVKRFHAQGKTNILIVVPTEAKSIDWIEDATHVELIINKLEGTNDAGEGIVVTTYANFYQNRALNNREWDLLVYDECHYLNQNSKGEATVYLHKHKRLANLPTVAKDKAREIMGDPPEYEYNEMWQYRADAWRCQVEHYTHRFLDKTKVLFLSATPFAYHKSIQYADGTLFDIRETLNYVEPPQSYNAPGPWESFMIENFGYQMKHNKLTIPDTGVDQGLMEREFFDRHVEQGIMSTRILELEQDYSRDFIKVSSDLGNFIDSGIEMWWKREIQDEYEYLSKVIDKKYNYMYVNQLLEAIKAQEVIGRIRQHLELGRKVVVFHGYNHTTMNHPFRFEVDKLINKETRWMAHFIRKDIEKWEKNFPEYLNLDLDNLSNARETLREAFPDMVEFNGTVPKKKRKKYEQEFNDDDSGVNLIMVQEKAGKEGISLHDRTGRHQRVLLNLSLPVAPTTAIQTEGRIYRSGVKSNAPYEYITLHTNFEKQAFAEKIATRSKTAENLAMGSLARDLETSFKEGYISAHNRPPHLGQGIGGKERDRILNNATPFDKAKTYYFARQKKTSKNKSFEGQDYFATPEPLGFKMLEWLNPQRGERGLEPSAGHGAIGRFFPGYCDNMFIEPSANLYSEMKLITSGKGFNGHFEDYHITNKFDYIAMNPPFGKGGKTAMEHIAKAVVHMATRKIDWEHPGSRLLAIVPCGSSMQARFDEFQNSKAFKNYNFTGEILLPDVTFKRAGTSVMCKIIRIEHVNTGFDGFKKIDLSNCSDIEEFFERLEHLNF